MSAAELVPNERFQEYRQKLNRVRRTPPADCSAVEPDVEPEAVAVAAVAVRRPAASEEPPQDFRD